MAFPVVATSASTTGTTATTAPAVDLPTGITSGDLLVVLFRNAANGGIGVTWPNGWTELADEASDGSGGADATSIAWRKADGTEGATITLTTATQKFAALALRITGAADPTSQPPELSTVATVSSNAPDPSSLSPTGGAKEYLWLWAGGWEGEQTSPPVSSPTNYGDVLGADSGTAAGAASNCRVAVATRALNAASEDPPSWTISATDQWTAFTIAVHPAGAATVEGSLTKTLAACLLAAVAAVAIAGTAGPSLSSLTASSAGAVAISGTSAPTLGSLTSTSAGHVETPGILTQTLAPVVVSSAGAADIAGTSTSTTAPLTLTAAGTVAVDGVTAGTLAAVTSVAQGAVAVAGDSAITLVEL